MGAFNYGGNGAALYSITKAAIHRMTEVLAVEWSRFNINVNCIAPGAFSSEMMDGMLTRMGDITQHFPRQRMGDPAQLDSSLLYLVSRRVRRRHRDDAAGRRRAGDPLRRVRNATATSAHHPQPTARPASTSVSQCTPSRARLVATATAITTAASHQRGLRAPGPAVGDDQRDGRPTRRRRQPSALTGTTARAPRRAARRRGDRGR